MTRGLRMLSNIGGGFCRWCPAPARAGEAGCHGQSFNNLLCRRIFNLQQFFTPVLLVRQLRRLERFKHQICCIFHVVTIGSLLFKCLFRHLLIPLLEVWNQCSYCLITFTVSKRCLIVPLLVCLIMCTVCTRCLLVPLLVGQPAHINAPH